MYITDFEYDGINLSDFGFIVCTFNTASQDTISNGSNIEFSTVPMQGGKYFALANSKYSEALTATFTICKNPCVSNYNPILSVAEISQITSWLNRRDFHELRIDTPGYEHLFFYGSFRSVSRVEFGGDVIGLQFEFIANAPFAYEDEREDTLVFTQTGRQDLNVYTDDIGEFYPEEVTIECGNAGVLQIGNCRILGCEANEIITLNYPMISTSASSHDIQNDFNYNFISLYKNTSSEYDVNHIELGGVRATSLVSRCTITFRYCPIRKIGL